MAFIGKNGKLNTNTYTPQSADPVNVTEGMIFRSDGTARAEGLWEYKNGNWVQVGSGSGAKNFYEQGTADSASTGDFSTGNNATFDGGGSFNGTFSISTIAADLIGGASAFKWVGHATAGNNDDDYIASSAIDIPLGFRGRQLGIQIQYKWDGTSENVKWVVKDQTNTAILTTGVELLPNYDSDNTAKEYTLSFFCPADCAQVKIGPQCITGEVSKTLIWDDVIVTPNPFIYKDLIETQSFHHNSNSSTLLARSQGAPIRFDSANMTVEGSNILTYDDSTGRFTANRAGTGSFAWGGRTTTGVSLLYVYKNGVRWAVGTESGNSISNDSDITVPIKFEKDDYITFQPRTDLGNTTDLIYVNITATASTENVVHHSSGTENKFTARIANSGSASITSQSSPNNPAIASVNTGSTGNVTVTFTSGFFNELPAVEVAGAAWFTRIGTLSTSSVLIQTYNASTTPTDYDFDITITNQDTDYKNPNAYAITPSLLTAYVKDIKAQNTAGGTFTQSAWQTRDLNDLSGDTSFISLASDQFTLGPGTYEIDAHAPCREVNGNSARLYNITDSTADILGSSNVAEGGGGIEGSDVKGQIKITASKTFEIQHYCINTKTTNGFGLPSNIQSEVYTVVRVTKVA